MSSRLLANIWDVPLGTSEKLAMAYLCDAADRNGVVPPIETKDLAEIIGRSPKTTRTVLKDLTDAGHIDRNGERWLIFPVVVNMLHVGPAADDQLDATREALDEQVRDGTALPVGFFDCVAHTGSNEGFAIGEPEPEPISPAPHAQVEAPASDPPTERLTAFCAEWGILPVDHPELAAPWAELEAAEAKHNRKVKHHDTETGQRWVENHESMEALLPAILHAVRVFQRRTLEGLPNHAATLPEFIEKQLWLAPDYQVALNDTAPKPEIVEAELDALVQEMNRFGGPMSCHLRTHTKDPETGDLLTETLEAYNARVRAKYQQFQTARDYLTE